MQENMKKEYFKKSKLWKMYDLIASQCTYRIQKIYYFFVNTFFVCRLCFIIFFSNPLQWTIRSCSSSICLFYSLLSEVYISKVIHKVIYSVQYTVLSVQCTCRILYVFETKSNKAKCQDQIWLYLVAFTENYSKLLWTLWRWMTEPGTTGN